jgi:protein-L-isoaspartate(D-aspartate) O-methyltransferase
MRVLEIGAGSGYNAALMAELVSDPSLITTLDLNRDLVERTRQRLAMAGYRAIHVLAQDSFYGCETNAPYDRIVATVSCSDLSPYWLAQLASNGFMLIPLSHGGVGHCPLVRVEKDNDRIVGRIVGYSNFMSIRGSEFPQNLWSLSSLEEEAKLVHLIQTIKPEIEYPLFQDLKEFPDHTPIISDEWAGRFEFHYFLALHTRQTFVSWVGTGLGDEQSFVLLGNNSIRLYGNQAPVFYQELESVYQRWVELGKPRMLDYTMEFIPLAGANEPKRGVGSNTWTIDRKFFRQIVSVTPEIV